MKTVIYLIFVGFILYIGFELYSAMNEAIEATKPSNFIMNNL